MYKASNGLSQPHISDIYRHKNSHLYHLRRDSQFSRPFLKNVFHRIESISYLGPIMWDMLPVTYNQLHAFL